MRRTWVDANRITLVIWSGIVATALGQAVDGLGRRGNPTIRIEGIRVKASCPGGIIKTLYAPIWHLDQNEIELLALLEPASEVDGLSGPISERQAETMYALGHTLLKGAHSVAFDVPEGIIGTLIRKGRFIGRSRHGPAMIRFEGDPSFPLMAILTKEPVDGGVYGLYEIETDGAPILLEVEMQVFVVQNENGPRESFDTWPFRRAETVLDAH